MASRGPSCMSGAWLRSAIAVRTGWKASHTQSCTKCTQSFTKNIILLRRRWRRMKLTTARSALNKFSVKLCVHFVQLCVWLAYTSASDADPTKGTTRPWPEAPASPHPRGSVEQAKTELSSAIRRIASAISGAIVTWRMLCARRTASVARIEFGHHQHLQRRGRDARHRAARQHAVGHIGGDRRGALLRSAHRAALHSVPPESTMSSTRMQSPAVDVADDVHDLGHAGALAPLVDDGEVGARAAWRSAGRASTPPTSGDTIITSPAVEPVLDVAGEQRARRRGCPPGCRRSPGSGRRAGPSSAPGRRPRR